MSPEICSGCGSQTETVALSCPECGAPVHLQRIQELAAQAQSAAAAGDSALARSLWAQLMTLLPEDAPERRDVSARIAELDTQIAGPSDGKRTLGHKGAAGLGPAALLLWKIKTIALVVLAKGKLLLLGLTKFSTLLSMFASLGVYWAIYGWRFALGIVISIYIHEMGHVQALRRYGVAASAPMFIPGFGAFIRLRAAHLTPEQDARTGLAGPLYGLAAAVIALGVYLATGARIWAAIAQFGAIVNLFNLIPVWQLDGGRGFHSLTRNQRIVVLCTAALLWYATGESMLLLITLGCAYRLFTKDAAEEPDAICLQQFAALLVALAAIAVFAKGHVLPL